MAVFISRRPGRTIGITKPSAALNTTWQSSTVRVFSFSRVTPLVKVLVLTLIMNAETSDIGTIGRTYGTVVQCLVNRDLQRIMVRGEVKSVSADVFVTKEIKADLFIWKWSRFDNEYPITSNCWIVPKYWTTMYLFAEISGVKLYDTCSLKFS